MEPNSDRDVLLYGITLVLRGHLDVISAIKIVDQKLYKDIGAMGFFELLSPHAEHCSSDYIFKKESILDSLSGETLEYIRDISCRYVNENGERDGNTRLSLIIAVPEYESLTAEYLAQAQDLNKFVGTGACIDWEQIELPEQESSNQSQELAVPIGKPVEVRFSQYGVERHIWNTTLPNATFENLLAEIVKIDLIDSTKLIKFEIRLEGVDAIMAKGTLYPTEFN